MHKIYYFMHEIKSKLCHSYIFSYKGLCQESKNWKWFKSQVKSFTKVFLIGKQVYKSELYLNGAVLFLCKTQLEFIKWCSSSANVMLLLIHQNLLLHLPLFCTRDLCTSNSHVKNGRIQIASQSATLDQNLLY